MMRARDNRPNGIDSMPEHADKLRKAVHVVTMAAVGKQSSISPARWWAWEILQRVERDGAYLDRVLEVVLRRSELRAPDRALLTELVHGVVRWKRWLDFVLQSFSEHPLQRYPLPILTALRLGAYQLLYLERVPAYAAVHQVVELVKPYGKAAAGLVNALLRALQRQGDALPEPAVVDVVQRLSLLHSYPEWIVRRWVERFGVEEATALLQAQNRRPRLALRVNVWRVRPEAVEQWLHERGRAAWRSPYTARSVIVEHLPYEELRELLERGWVSVHDVSALLVVELAAVRPGMQVLDLCGAPGGKACAMAEHLGPEGHITVVDIHRGRLGVAGREAHRLGVAACMGFLAGDARSLRHVPVDVVVLDAPCSGLGTIAKKPDIKWRRQESDLRMLSQLQRELLEHAATLVRPEGVLVYSTCTTEPEENEEIIADFLQRHAEFVLEPAEQWLPASVCRGGFLQTFPHRHADCDGAFAARLRRRG